MKINPWMRCKCGKMHVATYINKNTVCSCGENLYEQFHVRSTNAKGNIK